MNFDYVCPKMGKACIGERCAGLICNIETSYFYDVENITKINFKDKKDKRVYEIVERHYNLKKIRKIYYCAEYSHLHEVKTTDEKMDETECFHGHYSEKWTNPLHSKYDQGWALQIGRNHTYTYKHETLTQSETTINE